MFYLCVTCPPEICVNLVFKHVHAASRYTIRRQFVPFINYPNATSCLQVLLAFLDEKNIVLSIFP